MTDSLSLSTRVVDEAGIVSVNTYDRSTDDMPFSGVKESGHGQESGVEGLEPYLLRKAVLQASE